MKPNVFYVITMPSCVANALMMNSDVTYESNTILLALTIPMCDSSSQLYNDVLLTDKSILYITQLLLDDKITLSDFHRISIYEFNL